MKKRITRELKGKLDREKVKELKQLRNIINEQIEDEEHRKENARIIKTVDTIKKGGGLNSNIFWEVMKKLKGREEESAHAIMNKEGKLCEKPEEIKNVYVVC